MEGTPDTDDPYSVGIVFLSGGYFSLFVFFSAFLILLISAWRLFQIISVFRSVSSEDFNENRFFEYLHLTRRSFVWMLLSTLSLSVITHVSSSLIFGVQFSLFLSILIPFVFFILMFRNLPLLKGGIPPHVSGLIITKQVAFIKQLFEPVFKKVDEPAQLITQAPSGVDERQLLYGIRSLDDTSVGEVMTGIVDVFSIDGESSFTEVINMVKEGGYSRVPVYQNEPTHIIGILYVKDMLAFLENPAFAWQQLIRQPVFTKANVPLSEVLKRIKEKGTHIMIVKDEADNMVGIITLENIIEEVVGDLKDEFDVMTESDMYKLNDRQVVLDGSFMLEDFYHMMNITEDIFAEVRGTAESLGGMMASWKNAQPRRGDELKIAGWKFRVLDVKHSRVYRLLATRLS